MTRRPSPFLPDYTDPRHHPPPFRFHARAFFHASSSPIDKDPRGDRPSSLKGEFSSYVCFHFRAPQWRIVSTGFFPLIFIFVLSIKDLEINLNGLIFDLAHREGRENVEREREIYVRWFVGCIGDGLLIRCKYYRQIYIVHVERKCRIALCIFFVSRNQ